VKRLDKFLQYLRIRQAASWVPAHARVLDIGCADGVLHKYLRAPARYVGIDPDAPSTVDATVLYFQSSFPLNALDEVAPFDVIVALAVLEHVPRDQQNRFAAACSQLLAPGGVIVLTVPSSAVDYILAILRKARLLDGMKEEQHYGFDAGETAGLLEAHGLRLVEHKSFEWGLNNLFVFRKVGVSDPISPEAQQ
jgi:2-polyprenyl-3-methyl-5-hydroxy-6-metoxy-1,4-benzoquinol methylase